MYPTGTIKLTWIDPSDYTILESKMFRKIDLMKAVEEAKTKPGFMIFELLKTKNDEYTWKLLPYGEYKRFTRSMKLNDSILFKLGVLIFIGFGIYGITKSLK